MRARPAAAWAVVGLVAIALVPFVVALVAGFRLDWTPSGDNALLVLRMHDVGSRHKPMVGAYSRFGFSHPGPLLMWVGAPALKLFGPSGVLATMALLNAAWVAATVAAARRLGGNALAGMVAVAAAAFVHNHGAAKLIDPWNPWVAVLPLLCFVFCAPAFAASGARWTLFAALVAGSYAAQAHLGSAPVVAAGTVFAAIWWWRVRPPVDGGLRVGLAAVAVLALLWSGPVFDQFAGAGNAHSIVRFSLDRDQPRKSTSTALAASARELGSRPPWAGGLERTFVQTVRPAPKGGLLVLPALLLMIGVADWVRRDRTVSALAAYAAGLFVVSVYALSRTVGDYSTYILRWTWAVSLLAVTAVVWGAWRLLERSRASRAISALGLTVGLVVTIAAAGASVSDLRRGPITPVPLSDPVSRGIVRAVEPELPRGRYKAILLDRQIFGVGATGAAAALVRDGYDVEYPTPDAPMVGGFRATGGRGARRLIIISSTPRSTWTPPRGARLIARWDPRTQRERARLVALTRDLLRAAGAPVTEPVNPTGADANRAYFFVSAEGSHRSTIRELGALQDKGESYEVWLAPPER